VLLLPARLLSLPLLLLLLLACKACWYIVGVDACAGGCHPQLAAVVCQGLQHTKTVRLNW
jgi:hypothetical protein